MSLLKIGLCFQTSDRRRRYSENAFAINKSLRTFFIEERSASIYQPSFAACDSKASFPELFFFVMRKAYDDPLTLHWYETWT